MLNMFKKIYQWHDAFTRIIAAAFRLSDNLNHPHRLTNRPNYHKHSIKRPHKKLHAWHKEHNIQVTVFHKNHAARIERGDNGNGLLTKWERLVYSKGKTLMKVK